MGPWLVLLEVLPAISTLLHSARTSPPRSEFPDGFSITNPVRDERQPQRRLCSAAPRPRQFQKVHTAALLK
jgi:hypothetical protein